MIQAAQARLAGRVRVLLPRGMAFEGWPELGEGQ